MLKRENLIITLLLAIAALLAVQIFFAAAPGKTAYAGGGSAGARFTVAVAGIEGSSAEIVYLFDSQTTRLCTYHQPSKVQGRKLEILSIRNIEYDLRMDEFYLGKPLPRELEKRLKANERNPKKPK